MQCVVKTSVLALALTLCACGDDPEETPDITEAIPLNPEGSQSGDETAENGQVGESEIPALSSGPAPLPGASDSDGGAQERSIPDTMEAGSNPPGMTPPAGSKVQRVN